MTRYRLSCTIEEAHMSSVLGAISAAGLRSELDPEITLSLMSRFNHPSPNPNPVSRDYPEATHAMHPKPKRTVKRTTGNGAEWPAKGSIYDIVLEAIQGEFKTAQDLRAVLQAHGKSPGSLNSALGRLEKAGKAKRDGSGWTAVGG